MFATYGQGRIFLYCAFVGVLCGIIYEAGYLVRFICRFNKIIVFAADAAVCVLWSVIIAGAFYLGEVELRVFTVLGVILGIFVERVSFGFFIAKVAEKLYNICKAVFAKIFKRKRTEN